MASEKSCGAVVYRLENGRRLYLLLRSDDGYCGFPKGHVEPGETEEQTARRETREETGIADLELEPLFREITSYFFTKEHKKIFKEVVYFIAETSTKEVKMSDEHVGFEWLEYSKALEKLSFENAKELLKKAETYLSATMPVGAEDL